VFSRMSNSLLPFIFNYVSAAAWAVIINSLYMQTQIGPIIVLTTNLMVVLSSFGVILLSCGSPKSMVGLRCEALLVNILHVQKAPMNGSGCSRCIEVYMAKTQHCSRSSAILRVSLILCQLEIYRL
jgi:hypothetical protein